MESGSVNNLFNFCRPCIPQVVFQFASDHREKIEKVAMIAIFSATCLVTTATLGFATAYIFKFSCLLASPALATTVAVIGLLAAVVLIPGIGLGAFPVMLKTFAQRDFANLCQSKRTVEGMPQDALTVEEKSSIRSITNRMKLSELILSKGFPTIPIIFMLSMSFAPFPLGAVAFGFSGLSYLVLFHDCVWSPSPKELDSTEKAYLFTATSDVDLQLSSKILKIFHSSRHAILNRLNNFTLLKAIEDNLTPAEIRGNFEVLAKMIAKAADETQEVNEAYCLGKLFELALSGDVPADATLTASREVIQQAGRSAMSSLQEEAPQDSFSRLIDERVTTENISDRLTRYQDFLVRTGNAWEGMGLQVVGMRDDLGECMGVADL